MPWAAVKSARTKPHRSAGRVEFEIEYAFSRLSARIYLWVVAELENDIKKAGMTPRMPPEGAAAVAKSQAFLANDTTEQALADHELIETCVRYLRRRNQERKAVRKSVRQRLGKKRTSKRRSVRSRVKVKGPRRGANRK